MSLKRVPDFDLEWSDGQFTTSEACEENELVSEIKRALSEEGVSFVKVSEHV